MPGSVLINSWPVNVANVQAGRYWLNFGGGFSVTPAPITCRLHSGLKLTWVSNGPKVGGALNVSLYDVDELGNLLEQFTLGAPTDIGSTAQAGSLTVAINVASSTPSPLVQLWQRQLVYAAAAVDVIGGAVTWAGRFVLWGLS